MKQLNIAVVGSGISGLAAAWLLSHRHNVTLFEREDRLGGHANTVDVESKDGSVAIDTGFIVYNTRTYPNLTALLDHFKVATAPSCMSFAVSMDGGGYEYSGTGLSGLFGQRSNLFRRSHWAMTVEIGRFFREAERLAASRSAPDISLGQWLMDNNFSTDFTARHILPMGAAIWSVPAAQMAAFPAAAFARFFSNHGLLKVRDRPKWRTICDGSRRYVAQLLKDFKGTVRTDFDIHRVSRTDGGVDVAAHNGVVQRFDHCVLATHADQALGMISDADGLEQHVLSAFDYSTNTAVLHTDPTFMPRRKGLWSSWNYVGGRDANRQPGVSYWMNRLQPLPTPDNYFVTLNPDRDVAPDCEIMQLDYTHPIFDTRALAMQKELWQLQGRNRLWFAGSYFGYGFHEDGLQAGLAVAEELGGVRRPWTVANESDRLSFSDPIVRPPQLEAAQ
ncbi:MAG: NAD(P)/FAD-dependent oxidoreductase [Hyphomicrobiaceae bacterium]